jgi:acetolactate synthase-1/2/3 large subunit
MITQLEIDNRPATGTALVEMPTGAEMLIQALVHEGVDTIFGYPGGAVLNIYDELWRARDRITHYLVRHEQGAVHMAEGYARATGQIRGWQLLQPLRFSGSQSHIKPQTVIRELHRLTKGEALIATDVGQHQMWVAQFYPFTRPRQLITSGGLGTMGFGLPAAMGAQLALPNQLVVAVVGDDGFQMTNQELATAVQYGLPVKILVMNNGYLGMVRQWQEMFYDRTYSEVDISVAPDFVKLAEAYGAAGFRAERPGELRCAIEENV